MRFPSHSESAGATREELSFPPDWGSKADMPELPEVEVMRRSLEEIFRDHPQVEKIKTNRPDLRFPLPLAIFKKWKGVRIIAVHRRAKYLRIESTVGSLVCHLGMTGNFRLALAKEKRRTHDHVEIWLGEDRVLLFEDPRRFGFFLEWPGSWAEVTREELGPEPLDPAWTAEILKSRLKGKSAPIKNLLMDQRVVVGIGNIYASEVLFRAKVRPQRPAGKVTKSECEKIVKFSREILHDAIRQGGSSIRDYRSPGGEGSFQKAHLVYDREGQECVICGTPIRRRVMAGRSTFWCSHCQT